VAPCDSAHIGLPAAANSKLGSSSSRSRSSRDPRRCYACCAACATHWQLVHHASVSPAELLLLLLQWLL
jgi:hypothetical protein